MSDATVYAVTVLFITPQGRLGQCGSETSAVSRLVDSSPPASVHDANHPESSRTGAKLAFLYQSLHEEVGQSPFRSSATIEHSLGSFQTAAQATEAEACH